jgi:hypothetical protein
MKNVIVDGVEINESVVWLNDHECIHRGLPIKKVFKGIIRGNSEQPFTFFYNNDEQLFPGLILEHWIYYTKDI